MHGFRVSFLIATAAVASGLLFALFLPKAARPAQQHTQLRASSEENANLRRAEERTSPSRGTSS